MVNDAESNVFNGDLGYIQRSAACYFTDSKQDELTIDFDGNELVYQRSEVVSPPGLRHEHLTSLRASVPWSSCPSPKRGCCSATSSTLLSPAKSKLILLGEKSSLADYAARRHRRKAYLIRKALW